MGFITNEAFKRAQSTHNCVLNSVKSVEVLIAMLATRSFGEDEVFIKFIEDLYKE